MSLSFKDKLILKTIHGELNKSDSSLGVLLKLLEEYIELRPEELSSINSHIGVLTSIALKTKDKVLGSTINSVQFLLSLESENMSVKRDKVGSGVIAKCFIGAVVALFPNGCLGAHSSIESEFFNSYLQDLKDWQENDEAKFNTWLSSTCEYPKYIEKLVAEK